MNREDWLNGWRRSGDTVLIGMMVYCVGCGKEHGLACVVLSEDDVFPEKTPAWPFERDTCPICALQVRVWDQTSEDKLTARLKELKNKPD